MFFKIGWAKIPCFANKKLIEQNLPAISIVVAVRNEEKNIPILLQSLVNQTDNDFELIIINDHSSDSTLAEIEKFRTAFKKIIVVNAKNSGKKLAVNQAVAVATGNLILTTDADCCPNENWVATIRNFQAVTDCDLLILPVLMIPENSYFSEIQQFEFSTLVASGAGAAGGGCPILCNAANLAFKKTAYTRSQTDLHFEKQSGDDIFLLESVKKNGGKIRFLKSENVVVQTNACNNLQEFFRQRRRWAGKATAYSDKLLIFTALTVFFISVSEIITLILGIFFVKYLIVFLSIFLIKYIIDLIFIQKIKNFFKLKHTIRHAFVLSLIYPLYICVTAISAVFCNSRKW
ncbi:glycosyl transferase [Bacteroidia bacterium]|nr:glycosyl transferase [Bacteroidia bacterium]GHV46736.1 glycosyl transferase [Bacteroidia bacterium]